MGLQAGETKHQQVKLSDSQMALLVRSLIFVGGDSALTLRQTHLHSRRLKATMRVLPSPLFSLEMAEESDWPNALGILSLARSPFCRRNARDAYDCPSALPPASSSWL